MPGVSDPGYRLVAAAAEAGRAGHGAARTVRGHHGPDHLRAALRPVRVRGLPAAAGRASGRGGWRSWRPSAGRWCSSSHPAGWRPRWPSWRRLRTGPAGGGLPGADQDARGGAAGHARRAGRAAQDGTLGEITLVIEGARARPGTISIADAVRAGRRAGGGAVQRAGGHRRRSPPSSASAGASSTTRCPRAADGRTDSGAWHDSAMEISQHIAAIERDGDLMAAAAQQAGLDAAVPSCPPWQVRDLLKHQGYVHRWAATAYVAEQLAERVAGCRKSELLAAGPPDDELPGWFTGGYQGLARRCGRPTRPSRAGPSCPAPSPLAFWARRQAHETAIHRVGRAAGGRGGDAVPGRVRRRRHRRADHGILRPRQRAAAGRAADAARGRGGRRGGLARHDAAGRQPAWRPSSAAGDARAGDASAGDDSADTDRDRAGVGPSTCCCGTGPRPPDGGVSVAGDADLLKSWQDGMQITWG